MDFWWKRDITTTGWETASFFDSMSSRRLWLMLKIWVLNCIPRVEASWCIECVRLVVVHMCYDDWLEVDLPTHSMSPALSCHQPALLLSVSLLLAVWNFVRATKAMPTSIMSVSPNEASSREAWTSTAPAKSHTITSHKPHPKLHDW